MTVAAEKAVRAWVNSRPDLTGTPDSPGPLANGAFLIDQRSPVGGAWAVVSRQAGQQQHMTAENSAVDCASIITQIHAGTQTAAETAAAAYATAVQTLTGLPVVMGDTGITCLVADNVAGPHDIPVPPDQGEQYVFQVTADFYLLGSN